MTVFILLCSLNLGSSGNFVSHDRSGVVKIDLPPESFTNILVEVKGAYKTENQCHAAILGESCNCVQELVR